MALARYQLFLDAKTNLSTSQNQLVYFFLGQEIRTTIRNRQMRNLASSQIRAKWLVASKVLQLPSSGASSAPMPRLQVLVSPQGSGWNEYDGKSSSGYVQYQGKSSANGRSALATAAIGVLLARMTGCATNQASEISTLEKMI